MRNVMSLKSAIKYLTLAGFILFIRVRVSAQSIDSSGFSPWLPNGSNIYFNAGNVGIGTSNPHYPLEVYGNIVSSGNIFGLNLVAQNNISVGNFRFVNGAVIGGNDSIISRAPAMTMNASAINFNTDSAFFMHSLLAQTLTSYQVAALQTVVAGQPTSINSIKIDGTTGTISSPSGNLGFGASNLTTTGALNAGNVNFNGTIMLPSDTIGDSNTHLMQIDRSGHLTPVHHSQMHNLLYSAGPCDPTTCTSELGTWWANTIPNSPGLLWTDNCELVGVGTAYPDAPLSVGTTAGGFPTNFSFTVQSTVNPCPPAGGGGGSATERPVHSSTTPPLDVFTVDQYGNTTIGTGILSYPNANAALTISSNTISQQFLIYNPSSKINVFGIDNIGNTSISGGQFLIYNPTTKMNVFTVDNTGNTSIYGGQFIIYNPTSKTNVYTIDNLGNTNITGRVVIGSPLIPPTSVPMPSNYRLYVVGGILTEHCKVAVESSTNWSDFVFSDAYKLPSIDSVSSYVNKNHHLMGVPSAAEVVQNGIDVADMDSKMLQKIEEMTLYIVQLQQEVKKLENKVAVLSKEKK